MESLSGTVMLPAPALRHDVPKSPPLLLLHYRQNHHMQPLLLVSSSSRTSSPVTPLQSSLAPEQLAKRPSFQTPSTIELVVVGAGMFLLFYFTNFVVPALIFKDMAQPEGEEEVPSKKTILESLVGSIDDTFRYADISRDATAMKSSGKTPRGTGFGKGSKRVGDGESNEENIQS